MFGELDTLNMVEHAHFYLDRTVKTNNVWLWAMENLHYEAKIIVWTAMG
jgi:hypothetical protein